MICSFHFIPFFSISVRCDLLYLISAVSFTISSETPTECWRKRRDRCFDPNRPTTVEMEKNVKKRLLKQI